MSRHRLSFTEKRRRKLALKVARLDKLEPRTAITEPISVTALLVSALRIALAAQKAREAQLHARPAIAAPRRGALAIEPAALSRRGMGGAGGAAAVLATNSLKVVAKQGLPDDWLADTFGNSAATSDMHGISSPWQPTKRAGGGAALPGRGGSGCGAQAATVALVQGHSAAGQAQQQPASTPLVAVIPPTGLGQPDLKGGGGKPPVSQHPGASGAAHGGLGSGPPVLQADVPGGSGSSIIHENPSSEPSSSVSNASGFSQMSFQYFPIYVLDENDGIVLFNGQYQQASLSGTIDLYAQVKGTTVSTYSWTYNNMQVFSSSGASTYHFHVVLDGTQSDSVGSISLTVTNTSSQQESETFYFALPTYDYVTMPSSSSWPVTISPDLEEPGAPAIASQSRGSPGGQT
jgi:hypothetical protein